VDLAEGFRVQPFNVFDGYQNCLLGTLKVTGGGNDFGGSSFGNTGARLGVVCTCAPSGKKLVFGAPLAVAGWLPKRLCCGKLPDESIVETNAFLGDVPTISRNCFSGSFSNFGVSGSPNKSL